MDFTADNVSAAAVDLTPVDFNGDNISDIAFHRPGSTWGSVPTLIAQGIGQWTASNQATPSWANQPGVNALPGDYDGDGKTDIAFHRPGSNSNTIPILFSRNGSWQWTNHPVPHPANEFGAKTLTGDFNGDGKTDIAFDINLSFLLSFAQGNGKWDTFEYGGWGVAEVREALTGDFDADGTTDIAFRYRGSNVIQLSSVQYEEVANHANVGISTRYPPTPPWAQYGEMLPGDYNGDGRTDIAFHVPGYG